MADLGPLRDGASVAVIGSGPAGAGCALALHRIAIDRAQNVRIYLIEGKRFNRGHHNLCAGVFSPPIRELVTGRLGIPFPEHLVQGCVPGYVLHTEREQIQLADQDGGSVTMPRAGFDGYMLEAAAGQGIEVLRAGGGCGVPRRLRQRLHRGSYRSR